MIRLVRIVRQNDVRAYVLDGWRLDLCWSGGPFEAKIYRLF